MSVSIQDSPYFRSFATEISYATSPFELATIQSTLGNYMPGCSTIVALTTRYANSPIHTVSLPPDIETENVSPYFSSRHIYFLNDPRLLRIALQIDHSITFDTNAATYIKKIVKNRSLDGLNPRVKRTFDHLLLKDFNFDEFFYYIENIKQGITAYRKMKRLGVDSQFRYWKLLNKNFRRNIVYAKLFNSINCQRYQKNRSIQFEISTLQAMRDSMKFVYDFYASTDGQRLINEEYISMHRTILLQLLAMYRIQYSSKLRARAKFRQFLNFVQDQGEVYLDRESIMVHKYFSGNTDVAILSSVNPGGKQKHLMKKLANLAWDLTAIRFMEMMFFTYIRGDYIIPFF